MDISLFLKSKSNKSSNIAKDRLKLVLVHDRMSTSPEILENIRRDIMEVISKYVEIDTEELDINISNEKSGKESPVLFANIPIKDIRRNTKKD